MCFYWKSLRRQIRIFGLINKINEITADKYFNSRDYDSRIAAWASNQSEILINKKDLIKKIDEYKKKYPKSDILPRPKHWSGWNLIATSIEFWLYGPNRAHERLRYDKVNNNWQKVLLYP